MQLVKTPAVPERLVDYVEVAVREHAGCGEAVFYRDENPRVEAEEYLDDDVKHIVEHRVDTLVCDGREFEVEAVHELLEVGGHSCYYLYYIVHSFKPIRVQERGEFKLKPGEITLSDTLLLLQLAAGATLARRLLCEAHSENEKKQSQAREAKSQ